MEKTIVITGKTYDAAVENALAQLSLERDQVSIQVLQQAKPGFLGFGVTPAKIQVTYEAPDELKKEEAPKTALSSASRSKPKVKQVFKTDAPAAAPAPKAEAPKAVTEAKAPEAEPRAPKKPKEYAPAAAGSLEEKIEVFLKGLLEHMGSDAVPHAWKVDEETYNADLVGADLGFLIGKRGDTLDAIQHLCNYAVARKCEGHIRINVDAEDYRCKREQSLERYAKKKAQQVLKAHRRTTLEPMNAYERHIIHAALQDTPRITTYSVGTEPNRRVVIEYER